MDYLFAGSGKIEARVQNKFILLLLDYDGTLTPLVETPGKALISRDTKESLEQLSRSNFCTIAIISGRSLEDIKNMVGIEDIIYVGNHGLEIEGPKIKFENRVSPHIYVLMRSIAERLRKRLASVRGAILEDKGLTLSIHYRLVDKKDMAVFQEAISEIIDPYTASGKIKVIAGKKVYEIKPPVNLDKGKVALWLLARQQFALKEKSVFPVYIGDDVTDEDAFKVLKGKGLTVSVGEEQKSSHADYYVKNPEEVTRFLRLLLGLRHS